MAAVSPPAAAVPSVAWPRATPVEAPVCVSRVAAPPMPAPVAPRARSAALGTTRTTARPGIWPASAPTARRPVRHAASSVSRAVARATPVSAPPNPPSVCGKAAPNISASTAAARVRSAAAPDVSGTEPATRGSSAWRPRLVARATPPANSRHLRTCGANATPHERSAGLGPSRVLPRGVFFCPPGYNLSISFVLFNTI
jgi:hypothetical protein